MLQGILNDDYLQHLILFSEVLWLLLQFAPSLEDVAMAERLLQHFCMKFSGYYCMYTCVVECGATIVVLNIIIMCAYGCTCSLYLNTSFDCLAIYIFRHLAETCMHSQKVFSMHACMHALTLPG